MQGAIDANSNLYLAGYIGQNVVESNAVNLRYLFIYQFDREVKIIEISLKFQTGIIIQNITVPTYLWTGINNLIIDSFGYIWWHIYFSGTITAFNVL